MQHKSYLLQNFSDSAADIPLPLVWSITLPQDKSE